MGFPKLGAIIERVLSTVSAAGTLTLTNSSQQNHRITGTTTHTVKLPDATTCPNGRIFEISNTSTSLVTVQYNDASTFTTITPNTSKRFVLFSNASTNGDWDAQGGSGSTATGSGSKNYVANPTANLDLSGWSVFNTTFSGGLPTTITAGSTKIALNRQTTNPLEGAASFEFEVTTAAASTGHGVITDAMTIDDEDLAKILEYSLTYNFTTNPENVDVSGTSTQTLELWVYNVGLATWYQATGFRGINTKGTASQLVPGYVAAQIQTDVSDASSKNQYRVALIIRNDPAGTFKMLFDSVKFGPQKTVFGAPENDEKTFTTTTGLTGGTTSFTAVWRRAGGTGFVKFDATFTSIFTGGSATFTLPFTIDTSADRWGGSTPISGVTRLGFCNLVDTGLGTYPGVVIYNSPTSVIIRLIEDDGGTGAGYVVNGAISTTTPFTWANGDQISVSEFGVPVQGWSANVQMSQDTDTRVVTLQANTPTNGSIADSSAPTVIFGTVAKDTHGTYDPSSGVYTVPVSGFYSCRAHVAVSGTVAASTVSSQFNMFLKRNGTAFSTHIQYSKTTTALQHTTQAHGTVYCNAGDTLEAIAENGLGSSITLNGNPAACFINIERVSGPSAIAANETVAMSATLTTAQVGVSDKVIPFNNVVFDTHGGLNTSTGVYTVLVAGIYRVVGAALLNSSGNPNDDSIRIRKNGSDLYESYGAATSGTATSTYSQISELVKCVAGDTLAIFINGDASFDIDSGGTRTRFSIEKIGV